MGQDNLDYSDTAMEDCTTRLAEQIADGFLATQALAVVLPRFALSSWTTLPVPSSVTSRVPVRFSRLRRHCASTSLHLNH
jgi:hypothetical protein